MQWYETIYEMIDMRSFSNLWFWIILAVAWSSAAHYVMGVPFDMIQRARRNGAGPQADLEALARSNANRMIFIADQSGLWLTGIAGAILTALAVLGFGYGIEFCQAVFLLAFPMSLVLALSMRTARRIWATEGEGEALHRRLRRHRIIVQVIGMVAIFVTAMWGMSRNLGVAVLGG